MLHYAFSHRLIAMTEQAICFCFQIRVWFRIISVRHVSDGDLRVRIAIVIAESRPAVRSMLYRNPWWVGRSETMGRSSTPFPAQGRMHASLMTMVSFLLMAYDFNEYSQFYLPNVQEVALDQDGWL